MQLAETRIAGSSASRWLRILFGLFFVVWPFYLAELLYILDIGGQHYMNFFWAAVYAPGLALPYALGLVPGLLAGSILLGWYLLVSLLLYWLSGKLWHNASGSRRLGYALLMLASAVFVMDDQFGLSHQPFHWIGNHTMAAMD